MSGTFTPALMDSLPDDVLKILSATLSLAQSPNRTKGIALLDEIMSEVEWLSDVEMQPYMDVINAAMERRFGSIKKPDSFTSKFMDDLPDSALKSLYLVTKKTVMPEGKWNWRAIGNELSDYDKRQLQAFYSEVINAMERRFGPVPGI